MGLGGHRCKRSRSSSDMPRHARYVRSEQRCRTADVLLAVVARFDDRVIGNPKHFASVERKIIHIDIDPCRSPSACVSTSRSSAT